jgi:hypothetical protein
MTEPRPPLSKSDLLEVEERRLRKAFLPLMLLAVGAPLAAACLTATPPDSSLSALSSRDEVADGSAADAAADATDDDGAAPADGGTIDLHDGGACALQQAPEPADSDAGTCAEFKLAQCGLPPDYQGIADGCFFSLAQCYSLCHRMMRPCHAYGESCVNNHVVQNKPVLVECAICPGNVGRRPEGFEPSGSCPTPGDAPLGALFAELARLEAASIDAFDRLMGELIEHGAPQELVLAAERSRQDEVEHTRVMTRLSSRYGATPSQVPRATRRSRSLAEILRENMVEGCVRETFGALVAAWQASHSADPEITSAMQRVARDELRHAALSWAIARWSESTLNEEERASIASARGAAIDELVAEAERSLHPELIEVAGLPSGDVQRAMLQELRTTLWAA